MRIGLDFDNTIICYDAVFLEAARERGLVAVDFTGNKQAVRDAIRLLPDGELRWQELQGYVYGRGIGGAHLFEGLSTFLDHARSQGHSIRIVSHKTEFGHHDPQRVNLRDAARGFMRDQGFFDADGFGIAEENVHFAGTRAEKLARIAEVGCDWFIDDLEEVLDDPDFPAGVKRILFSGKAADEAEQPYPVLPDWAAIEEHVFNGEMDGRR